MNAPKRAGTEWESAVADWFRQQGFIGVERKALAGIRDTGDLTGFGRIMIPDAGPIGFVVGCKTEKTLRLGAYMDDLRVQQDNLLRLNGGAQLAGVLGWQIVKRRGMHVSRAYAVTELDQLPGTLRLLRLLED